MSDELKHTTQTNEILKSNPLIQRLDTRRTQPGGLINTRQSQRILPRLPGKMVQRFALLEQIQTRYGVSNNGSGTGTELTFATPSLKTTGEQTNTFTSQSAIRQPGTSTLGSGGNPVPTAKFRISRKAVPWESESFPSQAGSEPLSSPTPPSNQEALPPESSMILPKRISNEDTKTSARNSEIPSNSQGLLTAREIPLQVGASASPQATNNTSLVRLKDTTENLEEEIQPQPERVALSREITGNVASKAYSTMVWRQSSQVAMPGNNFSEASNGGTNNSFPLATTPVHHNGQASARQTTPTTMPMSDTTMSMPRQAAMPIPEINVGEIAEQVSRILCRQLTVERERRGFGK